MKKLLFLSLFFCAVIVANAQPSPSSQSAQGNQPAPPDQATMLKQMKETFKAPMVAKTGLTEAQVDKILEINLAIRMETAAAIQELSGEERSKKIADSKIEKEKRYAAIPLTAEQIKSVYDFYEEFAKNNPPQKRN